MTVHVNSVLCPPHNAFMSAMSFPIIARPLSDVAKKKAAMALLCRSSLG